MRSYLDFEKPVAELEAKVEELRAMMADEIVRRGAASAGLTWWFCRPPVDVLDYEMDVRGVFTEIVLP